MKRAIFVTLMWGISAVCFAQTATLDMSLNGARTYIEAQLPAGSKVLIADTAAPTKELGAYIAEELSSRLFNGRRLTVVERSPSVMQTLTAESAYQLSGEVDDNSIQDIGRKTGAEVVITGSIRGMGDQYRLSLKMTSVRSSELLGQWNASVQTDTVLSALLVSAKPSIEKPLWIYEPLSAKSKYETGGSVQGVSVWYYDVGISNKTTTEQQSRTRARQNVQQVIAENIASDMKARIDVTSLSVFESSGIEEAENRIEMALTNSIKTRVPAYEALEWYVENGNTGGKDWYIVYVLVRFPRKDIIAMVDQLQPAQMADAVIRAANIPSREVTATAKSELIRELETVRVRMIETIRDGYTGR